MEKFQAVLVAFRDVQDKKCNPASFIAPYFPVGQSTIDKFKTDSFLVTSLQVAEDEKIPYELLCFFTPKKQQQDFGGYTASIQFLYPRTFSRFVREFNNKEILMDGRAVNLEIHKHKNPEKFDAFVLLHNSIGMDQRSVWHMMKKFLIDYEFHTGEKQDEQLLILKK